MDPTVATKAAESMGEVLFKYGPWGMCSILIILMVALYWHMSKKNVKDREELGNLLEKRNNQLLTTVQRCINAMTTSTTMNKSCQEEMKKNEELLEEMHRAINRCRYAAPNRDE